MLGADKCDSQQWAGGDWDVGICLLQVPRTHRDTPRHQADQETGILAMQGVDECDSRRRAGGD